MRRPVYNIVCVCVCVCVCDILSSVSPANPAPVCDSVNGWQAFGSNCYKRRAGVRKSWVAARSDCVRDGGDLVSITSSEEEQYVTSRLDASAFDLWIGFSTMVRIIAVCYHWSDGTPVSHTNWGHGEPNNHNGRENCVEMVTTENGTSWWNDLNCDAHQDWICMIRKLSWCPSLMKLSSLSWSAWYESS
uniref:C-type lectin domain-containing protein n=1 Tax=Sinocyclocheilus anshuiensis TaxID=1608454 RepID=A0A671PK06_9TELE